MSFGLRDKDWVDPPEQPPRFCGERCDRFSPCPCGCGWGMCDDSGEYVQEGWECE